MFSSVKRSLVVFVALGLLAGLGSCGGGGTLLVDTSSEELTGVSLYSFMWFSDPENFFGASSCQEEKNCYLLDGKIKEVIFEPYLPEKIPATCSVDGELGIDYEALVSDLMDGETIVFTEEALEGYLFRRDDGEISESMGFFMSNCDYVRVTVKT